MKVIVAGSRGINDYEFVAQAIRCSGFHVTEVVSGTAAGVDRLGEDYAYRNDIPLKKFPADWDRHGKAAGHIRNREMAIYADALVAIHNGVSRGTANMIATAKELGLHVMVFTYPSIT